MIAIVGAGAAGLATAIFAARRGAAGRRSLLLDGAARPGAKILVSGGSRCNVTNAVVTEARLLRRAAAPRPARPAGASASRRPSAFFREIGVALHEEEHGKLFPDANRSRVVLQALLDEAGRRGVVLRAGERVQSVAAAGGGPRRAHGAGGDRRAPGRAGHGRAVAAEDGERRPRAPHGRGARPLGRPDDAGPRAAGARRRLSRAAVRRGAGGRDRGASGGQARRAPHGRPAVDALRGERPGGARRVARLAAGAARGPKADGRAQPAARPRSSRRSRASSCGCRPRARASAWRASSRAGCRRRWPTRWPGEVGARRDAARRDCAARSAGGWCTASCPGPLPVLESRGYDFAEATAGGVPLAEVDTADDGVAPAARASSWWVRCWTWTAASAGSTSSGPGRARGWRRGASRAPCDSLPRRERSRPCRPTATSSGDASRASAIATSCCGRRRPSGSAGFARNLRGRGGRGGGRGKRGRSRRLRGPAARGPGLRRGDGGRARGDPGPRRRAASTSASKERRR